MSIAVCRPQVPFARGGAEIFTDTLVDELRARGHEADLVSVPFKWYPGARVLTQAFLWRLLDLEESDGRPIDLVVATKFPSYVVRHPHKRVWLVHQFRQAYELDRTELGQFSDSREDRALRRKVQELDRVALGEAERLFATSGNVAGRLERSTGLAAELLPHPPQRLDYRSEPSEGFVLSASRLDRAKRIDLLLEAAALEPSLEVVVVSDGPDRERLERLAHARGLNGRVRFEGRVSAERLAELYARCRRRLLRAASTRTSAWARTRSFLSGKPVITTADAGGPLDVVARPRDRPRRRARRGCRRARGGLAARARGRGGARSVRAGARSPSEVTWDRAIARLLA